MKPLEICSGTAMKALRLRAPGFYEIFLLTGEPNRCHANRKYFTGNVIDLLADLAADRRLGCDVRSEIQDVQGIEARLASPRLHCSKVRSWRCEVGANAHAAMTGF